MLGIYIISSLLALIIGIKLVIFVWYFVPTKKETKTLALNAKNNTYANYIK